MAHILKILNPAYLRNLPADNDEAIFELSSLFNKSIRVDRSSKQYEDAMPDISAMITAFFESRNITKKVPIVDDGQSPQGIEFIDFMVKLNEEVATKINADDFDAKRIEYQKIFSQETAYIFSDNDFKNVQKLVDEIRTLIVRSKIIDNDHKRRLLRRLEAMQRELHKKTTDIDRFWGFIAEAGIAAKIFGENLKPITDRVETLGKIVIGVIMAKEGIKALPNIVKLLGH